MELEAVALEGPAPAALSAPGLGLTYLIEASLCAKMGF
jgi:hypothetical protein